MPLVVHARDADDDIIRIIKEEDPQNKLRGVMHCFSSSPEMGMKALDLGFYISFSGIVTFPKATELQNFAHKVPMDRLLVETDAPFLAPSPYRGKTNKPAYVVETAKYISGLLSISEEDIATHSNKNFFSLFSRAIK
jgi:TatD DNase family protein